jgi:alpha-N-arabinofuranosidase
VYRIRDKAASPVDERLFGQFLERPSWGGEMGIESAVTGQAGDIRRDVRQRLEELHATILRFPGGLDVDYLDWCDMVSNVPGREANRPVSLGHSGHAVTNGFGYDEFLALCGQLKSQPILVVNFADALLSRKSPEAAARHAAALVAYVNAPVDAALPEGLAPWPALREQNGRREPYGVRYFQVGNQTGVLLSQLRKGGLSESAANAQYVKCLAAYITAMRAVDPSIQILADACTEELSAALDAALHGQVNFWVQYMELPGDITPATIIRDGRRVRPRDLSPEETWNAWVAVPNDFSPQGESTAEGPALLAAARYGGKVAITDWNWSGRWWRGTRGPLDSAFAKGVGAAGFLHAILRQGDTIDIACQSIAVGSEWATAAIRVTDDFDTPAYLTPTGQVFMLYARHHGTARVEMEGQDIPTYDQPLRMGTLRPAAVVATVDAVATADGNALYFHAINRHFTQDITVTLDLEEFPGLAAGGVQHIFQGRLMDKPAPGEPPSPGAFSDVPIKRGGAALPVLLPKRSVSIVEIPREKTQK